MPSRDIDVFFYNDFDDTNGLCARWNGSLETRCNFQEENYNDSI